MRIHAVLVNAIVKLWPFFKKIKFLPLEQQPQEMGARIGDAPSPAED